jgi:hypothetical protein
MTRYELIRKCKEESDFTGLIASGLISITIAAWFDIYEVFLLELSKKENRTKKERYLSVTHTCEYYNNRISERNVYRIIKFMEN